MNIPPPHGATPGPKAPVTAPPVERTPMRAVPWFGIVRGTLVALLGMTPRRAGAQAPAAWQRAALRRRRVLLAIVAALTVAAVAMQWDAAPDPVSAVWLAHAALATLLFGWVGIGFVTALMGVWVMLRGDRHGLALREPPAPIEKAARTAVIMPICNEDVATVFSGLRATCESLAATGALSLFDFFVLSDTADPALQAAERRAWEQLRTLLGDDPVLAGGRVFYRHRRRRTQRKAGNVADFCRRWGRRYRYMVVLDADSTMSGDTLVSLVRLMEQHPRAGIVQTLPQSHGQPTLHARLQQFANRVTGRLFSLGMAYWQLGESHYWGHNAIIRVEPFMRHCALAPIVGRGGLSGHILSHDFVEAALMRRAGYEVWLAPQLEGSWEQHPPNLLAELQRDRRWCQGNLQNARLIAEPGWQPAHRAMFAVGALSYVTAPLWIVFVALGLAMSDRSVVESPLWWLTLSLLVLPRVLGVLATWLGGEQRRYGGSLRLAGSAVLEFMLSVVQAPLRMLAHTGFVLGAITGIRLEWKSPPREADAVGWHDAFARIGVFTLLALLAGLALLESGGDVAVPSYLVPVLLPLLLAVPFTVLTGNPCLGAALQRVGVLRTPDEQRPALVQARALARHGFGGSERRPAAVAVRGAALPFGHRHALAAFAGSAALLVAAVLPNVANAPVGGHFGPADSAWGRLGTPAASMQPAARTVAAASGPVRPRAAPSRPAQRIDDALRQRALEAVQRALEASVESPA